MASDVDELEVALRTLRYSRKWLEYGLLNPSFLEMQLRRFRTGEDGNTELYRFAAFHQILAGEPLSDLIVEQYLELTAIDPDRAMATSALYILCAYAPLTEQQLDRAAEHPLLQDDPRPVIRRRQRNGKT